MPIKSDNWIRRMSEEHGMIEPFEAHQVKDGNISYGLSSYGYDIRVASEFKVFTNVHSVIVDPKNFDDRSFVDVNEARVHHPTQLLRACSHRGVFPDSSRRLGRLRGEEHVRAVWHHRKRDSVGTHLVRVSHAGDLEHDTAPGEDLRGGGYRPAPLPRRGRRAERGLRRDRNGKYQDQIGVTLPKL